MVMDDWPDWKKLLAKFAIVWCLFSGGYTLAHVLVWILRGILVWF